MKYLGNNSLTYFWSKIKGKLALKQDQITSTNKLDYSLLNNTPTIPTVNNGTLTIQKNGTNIQTFTANQSSNVTANVTVPTTTSDLTNNSGFITSNDVTTIIISNTEPSSSSSGDLWFVYEE